MVASCAAIVTTVVVVVVMGLAERGKASTFVGVGSGPPCMNVNNEDWKNTERLKVSVSSAGMTHFQSSRPLSGSVVTKSVIADAVAACAGVMRVEVGSELSA